jgi:hypothetical protein
MKNQRTNYAVRFAGHQTKAEADKFLHLAKADDGL